MKKLIIIILCFSAINVFARNMDGFPKQISKKLNLSKLKSKHLKNAELKAQAATIFTILAFTQELNIHQMNGESENKVFLHMDGHKEAVYDGEGKLVKDCINQGSYNYYHPYQYPLGHFTADILPWLIWGNCREDKSNKNQRIEAYMADLKVGFQQVLNNNQAFFLPENFKFKGYGQSVAISFYLKVLETSEFEFSAFVPENIQNKKQQELFFKALENGFKQLLKNA